MLFNLKQLLRDRNVDPLDEHIFGHLRNLRSVQSECMLISEFPDRLAVGTGNLLRHGSDHYILTCDHVVKDLLDGKHGRAIFSLDNTIPIEILDPVRRDARDDIALLRVEKQRMPSHLLPLTISDCRLVRDFRTLKRDDAVFALSGFPDGLAVHKGLTSTSQRKVELSAMTYETVLHEIKPSTKTMLVMEYDRSFLIDGGVRMPEPKGMSGALVFQRPVPKAGEIDVPSGSAVALQTHWTSDGGSRNSISATSLRRLFEWLHS